jgi:hypothetical protein
MRRARQILLGELKDIEDLTIRNTDSLIEYPTLGEVLSGLSSSSLNNRLEREKSLDPRAPAKTFYQLYAAERGLRSWNSRRAIAQLDQVIESARPQYDALLKTHASLLRLGTLKTNSSRYQELAYRIFFTAPAELRNYGYRLPVKLNNADSVPRSLRRAINSGAFIIVPGAASSSQICELTADSTGQNISLSFSCPTQPDKNRKVEDSDPARVVNKLNTALVNLEKNH